MRTVLTFALLAGLAAAQPETTQTGVLNGRTVHFTVQDGWAVGEGDIILGRPEELTGAGGKQTGRPAITTSRAAARWPERVVPYEIADDLPNQSRVTGAIRHWNERTVMRLVPRTDEANYVRFTRPASAATCSSFVGLTGRGAQAINIGDSCTLGNTIHEIGHAVGLWHEQSRHDRAFWLRVNYANIDKNFWSQYDQQFNNGEDVGPYDYASIMHYSTGGFARNRLPTMETIPSGMALGQRTELSPGDCAAVAALYGIAGEEVVITASPAGATLAVDGQPQTVPYRVRWADGSQHTLSAPEEFTLGGSRYRFGRWSNNGARTQTITHRAGQAWYAVSYRQQVRLQASASGNGRVEVTPASPDGFYTVGDVVTVRAAAGEGSNFVNWLGSFTSFAGEALNPVSFAVTPAASLAVANFTSGPVTRVETNVPGTRVTIDGRAATLPAGFTWPAGSTHTMEVTGAQRQQAGSAVERWLFRGWTDRGAETFTYTAGAESATVGSEWTRQWLVTGTFTGGRVESTPRNEDGYYDAGAVLRLVPVANGGREFTGWRGDLTGTGNPAALTVDDQKAFTASFAVPQALAGGAVMNAASYDGGVVAPGQMVTLFGLRLGPAVEAGLQLDASGRVARQTGGTQVLFDGVAAPMVYASAGQLAAVVPYAVAGKEAVRVEVRVNGNLISGAQVAVQAAQPGIFTADATGSGPCACLNQDGTRNSPENPAARGTVVVLYATGEGQTVPAGEDGKLATAAALPRPVLPVRVRLAGTEAPVEYAGGVPGLASGLMQINVRLPVDAPAGNVPLQLVVGGVASRQTATVAVQ